MKPPINADSRGWIRGKSASIGGSFLLGSNEARPLLVASEPHTAGSVTLDTGLRGMAVLALTMLDTHIPRAGRPCHDLRQCQSAEATFHRCTELLALEERKQIRVDLILMGRAQAVRRTRIDFQRAALYD